MRTYFKPLSAGIALVGLLTFAVACEQEDTIAGSEDCEAGAIQSCECADGNEGTQSCADDGQGFTRCDCDLTGGAGGIDGSGGMPAGGMDEMGGMPTPGGMSMPGEDEGCGATAPCELGEVCVERPNGPNECRPDCRERGNECPDGQECNRSGVCTQGGNNGGGMRPGGGNNGGGMNMSDCEWPISALNFRSRHHTVIVT